MKKKVGFSLAAFFVVAGLGVVSFFRAHSEPVGETIAAADFSSAQDSGHLAVLKSIPLVEGFEKPKSDEMRIATSLFDIFRRFAAHNVNADGSYNRGTHAKGECFKGVFTIFDREELKSQFHESDSQVNRLKQGLFASDGRFAASIRFANADGLGRKQSDTVTDVRGFSFSTQTPETYTDYNGEHRQDFMFNSAPAFATGNIHEFFELVKLANIALYRDFTYVPNLGYAPGLIKSKVFTNGNDTGRNTKSYGSLEYWANLPYSHGLSGANIPKDLVKYKITPCDGKRSQHLADVTGLGADYLQKDIEARAAAGTVCMLLQVQFFDMNALRAAGHHVNWGVTDWVENGGLLWDESIMPFHTVAKIEIPVQTDGQPSPQISCDDQYINTRLHSSRANQPLGSIARVRTLVEETSRARRMTH